VEHILFCVVYRCIYALVCYLKSHTSQPWFSAGILLGMALLPMRWIYDLALGFLILPEIKQPRNWFAVLVIIVLCLPWMLSIFPEPGRWQAMVVIIPIGWTVVWIVNNLFARRVKISNHGSTEIQVN
jgi:hypothetical protein